MSSNVLTAKIAESTAPETAQALPSVLVTSKSRPYFSVVIMLLSDQLTLTFALVGAVLTRYYFDWMPLSLYWNLWPILFLFPFAFASMRLYPLIGISPAEELRRLTIATTLVYMALGMATFLTKDSEMYSRTSFLLGWILSLVLVPLSRATVRTFFVNCRWWGEPCIVMGAGKTGQMVVRALQRNPGLGLKPIAVLDDDPQTHGTVCGRPPEASNIPESVRMQLGVPVSGGLASASHLSKQAGVTYAIVAMPGVAHHQLIKLIEQHAHTFSHLIVVPDLFGFASLNVPVKDLGGVLGVQIRQQLLQTGPRLAKRFIDLVLTVPGTIVISPLLLFIWAVIRLDSRGAAVFVQKRPGRDGKFFNIYKFRTMHQDAEERMKTLPAAMRQEFQKFGKIKNDPRITRVGRILRRTSFDELPQIWNVLKGEMSLVGPRAFVVEQLDQIDEDHSVLFQVSSGITGLWQVSGRSELTFDERLDMDVYYVRNWSVWLDIYILARTVKTVLMGNGAY